MWAIFKVFTELGCSASVLFCVWAFFGLKACGIPNLTRNGTSTPSSGKAKS